MGDNGKGIRQLNTWPRALLKLPLAIRLAIVGGTVCFALLFYMLSFSTIRNGYILAIPIILVAWTFKRKGLFSFVGIIIVVLGTYQLIRLGGLLLPPLLLLSFISGLVLLIIFGLLIVALRNSFDAGEDARLKAQHAEQQIAIAYQQQRQLNELKNQFILNVNHELRSPLTVVSGYLSLLPDKQMHFDQQAQDAYLK